MPVHLDAAHDHLGVQAVEGDELLDLDKDLGCQLWGGGMGGGEVLLMVRDTGGMIPVA